MSQTSPDLIAEATKRAGLIWITIDGQDRPRPAWHVWRASAGPGAQGAAYVVTGPGEQPLPGLADASRVTVIVPASQVSGGRLEWRAAVGRVQPGSGEWDEVIGPLVAGRLNAVLAEGETSPVQRWARSGAIFRLAPVPDDTVPEDTALDDTAPGVQLGPPQLRAIPAGPGHGRTRPLITGVGGTAEAVPPTPPGLRPRGT